MDSGTWWATVHTHITKKEETHKYREQTSGYQQGEGGVTNYWVQDILYNMANIANIL